MGTLAVAAVLAIALGRDGSTGITQSPSPSREAVLSGVSSSTAPSTGQTDPTEPTDATPTSDTYLVQPGDTLRGIARSVYGDELQWRRIFDANRAAIPDEDELSVGQVLVIPRP
ncbi:MAG: LysM peptidoglycan-binding domain-containing protein [Chloroflexota bacterium]